MEEITVDQLSDELADEFATDLEEAPSNILSSISRFDRFDLLAALSVAQLAPANLSRTVRLEYVAQIACLAGSNGTEAISADTLSEICNKSLSPAITMQEDVCLHPFTCSFPFVGGCHTVFSGISPDQAFVLRQLVRAIFLRKGDNPLKEFAISVSSTLRAVLLLSDELARRFALRRFERSEYSHDVLVPAQKELERLKRGVVFTIDELDSLFRSAGLSASSLDPLVTPFASLGPADIDGENGTLLHRPIVRRHHEYVTAIPGMLLPALRHWIICEAVLRDVVASVAQAFHLAICSHVRDTFKLFDCPRIYPPIPAPNLQTSQTEHFYSLDCDKILHVLVSTDSLENYDGKHIFGNIHANDAERRLMVRIQRVRSFMRSRKRIHGLLTIIVSQGVGRTVWHAAIGSDPTADHHELRFSAEALELISLLEGRNQLAFWQFAKARATSLRKASVIAANALSEYGLFRTHNASFYLSDKSLPDNLLIASDYADEIRQEVADKLDLHCVPAYWANALVEVTLLRQTRNIPIYFPYRSLPPLPSFVVEHFACPIWVASSGQSETDHAHDNMAESVAYWLWQLSPSLAPLLASYLVCRRTILIHIRFERSAAAVSSNTEVDATMMCDCQRDPNSNEFVEILNVDLPSGFIQELRGESNQSERKLCVAIVRGLSALGGELGPLIDEPRIQSAIDQHIPLGRKKHLLVVEIPKGSGLDPTGLPPLRDVQDAACNAIEDQLGEHLRNELGLSTGTIPADKRTEVLRASVSYCFSEIERIVGGLSPTGGMLERLVIQHEACVHGRRQFELHMVPREECYGDATDVPSEQIEKEKLFSHVGPALRFLIEYVTTRPPCGRGGVSLSIIDELIALASKVIDYGTECDYLHHKLIDLSYSMLPSGRLGCSRASFRNLREAYFRGFVAANVRRARDRFARYWPQGHRQEVAASDGSEFDNACVAEYGFAITHVASFLQAASEIAFEHHPGVAVVSHQRFLAQLKERLGFTRKDLAIYIEMLSLRARDSFLKPPQPFCVSDVYPWIFGRNLSYLVRPLLRRQRNRNEVVLGPRFIRESFEFVHSLYLGKRQQPRNPELRAYLSKSQEAESRGFVDEVHALLEGAGLKARKNVEKEIPGFRNLGDIDVLAIDAAARRLLLVECKDLVVGRTPGELRWEVERLFEDRPNARSEITKHLRRLAWFKTNMEVVLSHFRLDRGGTWDVLAIMVASGELFGPFLRQSPLLILSLDELSGLLKSGLWEGIHTHMRVGRH